MEVEIQPNQRVKSSFCLTDTGIYYTWDHVNAVCVSLCKWICTSQKLRFAYKIYQLLLKGYNPITSTAKRKWGELHPVDTRLDFKCQLLTIHNFSMKLQDI